MPQAPIHRASRILASASHAYPDAWRQFEDFRAQRNAEFTWPEWCYIPIAGGIACIDPRNIGHIEAARRAAIMSALGAWRMTQGIYRFDPALMEAVLDTPMDGDIPADHLLRLPDWCVYVELPGDAISPGAHGVWLHMEYDMARGGRHEFRAVLDLARDPRQPFSENSLLCIALPLGGRIDQSLDDLASSARAEAEKIGFSLDLLKSKMNSVFALVRPMLSLALYLCADADIRPIGGSRAGFARRAQPMSAPASSPTSWDVGTRIGAALRAAYAREQIGQSAAPGGRSVRPHVRRAHWHTVLSGPKRTDGGDVIAATDRLRDLRWMPPIPVNVTDLDAMPSVIHHVRKP